MCYKNATITMLQISKLCVTIHQYICNTYVVFVLHINIRSICYKFCCNLYYIICNTRIQYTNVTLIYAKYVTYYIKYFTTTHINHIMLH